MSVIKSMWNAALNLSFFENEKKGIRDGIGESLLASGSLYKNLYVLTADLRESTKLDSFANAFPERFFDVGVAEQNLAGVSAGIGLSGGIAVMSSYSVFSPARNWDQIRVSICYSNANVKIIGGHCGLTTGKDGATHQALEDIAITRVLPNMIVVNPLDYEQAKKALLFSLAQNSPVYIRSYKEKFPQLTSSETPFEPYKIQVLKEGADLTIFSSGPITFEILKVLEEIENELQISIELVNVPFIKPLDVEGILSSIRKTKIAVSIDEHQVAGGLGSAILEGVSEIFPVPFKILGVNDTFGESGDYLDLFEKYEISGFHLKRKIIQFFQRNK